MNKMKKEIAEIKMLMLLASSNQIAKFVLRSIRINARGVIKTLPSNYGGNFCKNSQ